MKKSETYKEWLKRPEVKRELSIWRNPGVKLLVIGAILFLAFFIVCACLTAAYE